MSSLETVLLISTRRHCMVGSTKPWWPEAQVRCGTDLSDAPGPMPFRPFACARRHSTIRNADNDDMHHVLM